jgi:radical SAM superfamily enzyme YgiQ (UPF0313 family)
MVMDVCTELIAKGYDSFWTTQTRSTVGADDGLMAIMAKANCTSVCVGYESDSPEKLKEYGKGKTMSIADSVAGFHRHKIAVQMMMIYDELTDYLSLPGDYLQISILTPIPGSALFDRVRENGLFIDGMNPLEDPRWWAYFDGGHVVHRDPLNKGKPEPLEKLAQIQQGLMDALTGFYSFKNAYSKKRLKGGIDWKRFAFWAIARRARRQKRGFVDLLKRLHREEQAEKVASVHRW